MSTEPVNAFAPARWPGGPHICEFENLPAFATAKELHAFDAGCDANHILCAWECQACHEWHATYEMRAPSGATSGSGRQHQPTPLPRVLKDLLPKIKPRLFESMGERWMLFDRAAVPETLQDQVELMFMQSMHGQEQTVRENMGQWKFVK